MDEEMMKLTVRKYRGETSVDSARLPGDLVAEVDKVAKAAGRTRNDVVQICLEFAIERIELVKKGAVQKHRNAS